MRGPLFYRRVTEWAILALFFFGLATLIHEIAWLENTLDLSVAVLGTLAVTSVIAVVAYRCRWLTHAGSIDRWAPWVMFVLGVAASLTAGTSYMNRQYAKPLPPQAWMVSQKEHQPSRPKSPEQWKLLLSLPDESQWVRVSRTEWHTAQLGQRYSVSVQRGLFGIRFVVPPSKSVG